MMPNDIKYKTHISYPPPTLLISCLDLFCFLADFSVKLNPTNGGGVVFSSSPPLILNRPAINQISVFVHSMCLEMMDLNEIRCCI